MRVKKKMVILGLLLPLGLIAQPDPAHFSYTVKPVKAKMVELHITATMDEGWHIYSQMQPEEAISIPTTIVFHTNPLLTISGKPKEIGTKEKYEDKVAGIVQYQYRHVDFVQAVTLKSKAKTNISGTITYQACTEEMCLLPKTIPFSVVVQP